MAPSLIVTTSQMIYRSMDVTHWSLVIGAFVFFWRCTIKSVPDLIFHRKKLT